MSWSYAIMKHTNKKGDWYAVHEVFFGDSAKAMGIKDKNKVGYTKGPISITADTKEEVIDTLKMILKDVKGAVVFDYETGKPVEKQRKTAKNT